MLNIADYEKIATMVTCRTSGGFGQLTDISADTSWTWRAEVANGPVVLVRGTRTGWEVRFKSFIGADRDLETAARLALEAGQGIDATRNHRI